MASKNNNNIQTGLIVTDLENAIVKWLLDPFQYHEKKLFRRLKLKLTHEKVPALNKIDSSIQKYKPDILFLAINWVTPADKVTKYLKSLYQLSNRPRIVFLDYSDPTSTPFFGVLPYVDLLVRKQLLSPIELYNNNNYRGKNIFSDFISRHYDIDLNNWEFGSKIPSGYENRVLPGWNLGTSNSLSRPARYPVLRKLTSHSRKKLDLTCRLTLREKNDEDPNSIYYLHRKECMDSVTRLGNKYKIVSNPNGERVSYRAFQREIRESKMAVSPFGWGEITDRDFRIINARTLLIKPDMSHMETYPDVFRAGETYAPVKWDFSNLEEVFDYYIHRPAEAQTIANNAIRVYDEYFSRTHFIDKIEEILELLGT